MNKRSIGVFGVLALCACGASSATQSEPRVEPVASAQALAEVAPAKRWSDAESPVPVTPEDPVWGNRHALVTLVIFGDYECPFTVRAAATIEQLQSIYGPEQLRVVWKNNPLPFHPNARPAAEAAMSVFALAGPHAFWAFHRELLRNRSSLDAASFAQWALEAGVPDEEALRRHLLAHGSANKVDRDIKLAEIAGVNGTPVSYVNGVLIAGAVSIDHFKSVIDAELLASKDAVAKGARADRIYVQRSSANVEETPFPKITKAPAPTAVADTASWRVAIGTIPPLGPATALVTIVEFGDFQCSFCKRVEETLQRVRATYGDRVRLVWRHLPLDFHPRAEPAAQLAAYALSKKGGAGFWAAHDRLFQSLPQLEDDALARIASDLGLDAKGALDAIEKHKFRGAIEADIEAGEAVNASGTPHFFINGRRLIGAQPFETFQAIIDQELAEARELVAKGTPAPGIYDEIMKTARVSDPPERKDVAIPSGAPWKGRADAKIVIQEFADFQCPFCARAETALDEVRRVYGDKVKLVWRHRPLAFHADAELASEATVEAFTQKGSSGFWRMHDLLLANQTTPEGLKRPALEKYAAEIGLDVRAFQAALERGAHRARVQADADAADAAGIKSTPIFLINGYVVSGAQPFAKFRKLIDRALAEKK